MNNQSTFGTTYSNLIFEYINGKEVVLVANFLKQSPSEVIAQKNAKKLRELISKQNNLLGSTVHNTKFYDINLFTSKQMVQNNPMKVKRFKEATIKGWKYALKHKEELIELILEKYNTQNKSKEFLKAESIQIEKIMLPRIYPIGSIDLLRIKLIADNFIELGLNKENKDINFHDFIFRYNRLDAQKNKNNKLDLTEEEKRYLRDKKLINMCVTPNWYPFESIDKYGKHVGLGSKYIEIFSKSINIPIKLVNTKNLKQSLTFAKKRSCDILSLSMASGDRREYMDFTTPYFSSNLVIVGKQNIPFVGNIREFSNKKIGITRGNVYFPILKNKYKNLNLVQVNNLQDGLSLIENNKLDGYIDALSVLSNYIQHDHLGKLKVIAKLDYKCNLSVGTRNDEPILNVIFQKAVDKLTLKNHENIKNEYVALTIEDDRNYIFILEVLIVVIIVLFLLLTNQILLRKKIKKAIDENNKKNDILYRQTKLASLGEMIAIIAHQWRQPLAQLGFINMYLGEVTKNEKEKEKIKEAESILEFMSQTIDNFQSFYNKDEDKAYFFISTAIEEALFIVKANLKALEVEVNIDVDKSIKLYGNKNNISQVVLALIQNSVDLFKSKNTENPTITISLNRVKKNIILAIQDNAGGISQKPIESIFDPFVSSNVSEKSSGLGLYMTKKIIEDKFGGTIAVLNKNGGACFGIIFK